MNEREITPTSDIIKRQNMASDPYVSVWVEANAGSGKTHVLVNRVLRLLLIGVAPQNLLCLTFTNAAAAEMRMRVAKRLSKWALMNDNDLQLELEKLNSKPANEKTLLFARKLFASTLETPGGLKINTIHAFCESVLHRFAIEAKVPINFTVMEEVVSKNLIDEAREQVIAQGIRGQNKAANSIKWLLANMSDSQISDAINGAIYNSAELSEVLTDVEKSKQQLKKFVNYNEDESVESLTNDIVAKSLFPPKNYVDIFAIHPPRENPKSLVFEDKLNLVDIKNPDYKIILDAFLTKEFGLRKKLLRNSILNTPGNISTLLLAEADRLYDLVQKIRVAELVKKSSALIDLLSGIFTLYQRQKQDRNLLDFSDLIEKTNKLFSNSENMDWVLYKLDANIEHILVDESQDTNFDQWAIVKSLCEEFYSGKTSIEKPRTLFAVGDKKQSIYSFQGAKPHLFSDTGVEIKLRAKNAKKQFANVELKASFRTLPNILDAVDLLCQQGGISEALLAHEHKISHESARKDLGGKVELWPVIFKEDITVPTDRWPLEKDDIGVQNAAKALAERIANNIENWLKTSRPLAQRGRSIKADDILILVQTRNEVFHEIINALKKRNISTLGADRLSLSKHIAVLDLLALADILLNPNDDLNLAAVLRSPLFNFSEDDLFDIAANRKKNFSLWRVLKNSPNEIAKQSYQTLIDWRKKLDFERPYEFFAQVLYAQKGLQKFHARLGQEVDDVLSEFLDLAFAHELNDQPSLQGFLNEMRKSNVTIKREIAQNGTGVRIMSIHGAKGLEAPIVILADASKPPDPTKLNKKIYFCEQEKQGFLVFASAKKINCNTSLKLGEQYKAEQIAEYWRKLYVAMTRAEDELYLCGIAKTEKQIEGSWFEIVKKSLEPNSEKCEIFGCDEKGIIFPKEQLKPKPLIAKADKNQSIEKFIPKTIAQHQAKEFITPSTAATDNQDIDIFDKAFETIFDAEFARKKGVALHALLEHLTKIESEKQLEIGLRALEILLPQKPNWHEEIITKAISILQNKLLFNENSRAEIPFLVEAKKSGKSVKIAGRIDRIIINKNEVLLVDYKSDLNPANNEDDVSKKYLTQLGLYQLVGKKIFTNKKIKAAIFWTQSENLMYLSDDKLKNAVLQFSLD